MSNGQDDHKNEKLIKLARKVKTLSKIVNELQAEVDDLKSRAAKEQDTPIPEEPKITDANGLKLNRFQRLKLFRKDNKTKEKFPDPKTDTSEKLPATASNEDVSHEVHARTAPISRQQQATYQPPVRELSADKSHRKSRSTQSVSFPKEVEFSCIVQTCASQTEYNFEDSASSHENMESESNFNAESICNRCDKKKKSKIKKDKVKTIKSKTSRCTKDCPYLVKDNKDNNKKKKKYKSKKKDASVEACCSRCRQSKFSPPFTGQPSAV